MATRTGGRVRVHSSVRDPTQALGLSDPGICTVHDVNPCARAQAQLQRTRTQTRSQVQTGVIFFCLLSRASVMSSVARRDTIIRQKSDTQRHGAQIGHIRERILLYCNDTFNHHPVFS